MYQILDITLEQDFKEVKGKIAFHINQIPYLLKKHRAFNFPVGKTHGVDVIKDSKFSIVR